MRIDAHHHLWQHNPEEFAWIDEPSAALRRDFLPAEFEAVLLAAGVDASVVVQACQTLDETRWLLACARQSQRIVGVVGWLPLLSGSGLAASLEEVGADDRFVGVREILQDKPAGFLQDAALNEGMRRLTAHGLPFDLLLRASQLDEAIRFVDMHPNQRFVLDHAGKPPIARHGIEPWASSLRLLGQRSNVFCKLSGMTTEADWQHWTAADLHPYLDTCLEAFGPDRCMAGSDWPVCLVATQYERWWGLLEQWTERLSAAEQRCILGDTAARFYRLIFAPRRGDLEHQS